MRIQREGGHMCKPKREASGGTNSASKNREIQSWWLVVLGILLWKLELTNIRVDILVVTGSK